MAASAAPPPSAPTSPPFANPLANPALLANPYPFYTLLRQSNPVFRAPIPVETGAGVWILTRHADVELALKDKRFSVDRTKADVARLYPDRLPRA
ncbi:MAG TPA: hypothetical protein VHQ66_12535, partial [Myxococcota bacterium]|nr:hypothetical protein [Myxococcota bacterium]